MTISEKKEVKECLLLLKMGTVGDVICWCDMAIGNPILKAHTLGCQLAYALWLKVT